MSTYDILIKNGQVLDGSGDPAYKADIGIRAGKIAAIQPVLPADEAERLIDAQGMTITPGFIDVHTHDDLFLLRKPTADEKILQGITTVITGNCGFSPAPLLENGKEILRSFDGILGGGEALKLFGDQVTFGEFLNMLEQARPGINVGTLVGNVTIRIAVMGHAMRQPTTEELSQMKALVSEAMQNGAFGLSTGLIYAPGSYAQTDELIELAKEVARYDGIYTTHMRNESDNLLPSIAEAIQIGESAGVRVQISHFKVSGKKNWGKSGQAIALIEAARQRGLKISADQYPYNAGSTGLFALLPPDVLSAGVDALSERLADPDFRETLRKRMSSADTTAGMLSESDFEGILIASSPKHPQFEGKSLAEIARAEQKDTLDLIFDLVGDEKLGVTMVIFNMNEEDIARIMQCDFVMMGSDGLPSVGARIHPRMSGSAPRILGRYSRQQGVLSLEQAIRKMTSLSAQTFRLQGKGLLKDGYDADLVIFDPQGIIDQATYDSPNTPPSGIQHVLVNGIPAVEDGRVLGARSGKILRYQP